MRLVLVALCVSVLGGCSPTAQPHPRKLRVLTSILPIYCFTANVAGDRAEVESLISPGADAHDFQFTPRERRLFDQADLVVINALKMESWIDRVARRSDPPKAIVEATAGLESQLLRGSAGSVGHHDASGPSRPGGPGEMDLATANPHVWLDPLLAARMVTNILDALQKADPANARAYATNAAAYLARLEKLDQQIGLGLASITNRNIVTYHDAFPYFARHYRLNVIGVIEEWPDVSPTARHLTRLRRVIEANGARAIFTEPGHSDKLARQFAADLHLRVAPLDTLETGEVKPGAYEEGMTRNFHSLRDALN